MKNMYCVLYQPYNDQLCLAHKAKEETESNPAVIGLLLRNCAST